jgi:hypothetical protein
MVKMREQKRTGGTAKGLPRHPPPTRLSKLDVFRGRMGKSRDRTRPSLLMIQQANLMRKTAAGYIHVSENVMGQKNDQSCSDFWKTETLV